MTAKQLIKLLLATGFEIEEEWDEDTLTRKVHFTKLSTRGWAVVIQNG